MGDIQSYLPTWLLPIVLPSAALVAFFWKGDDALSTEFKQWLGEKLSGIPVSVNRATMEPLERVFDLIYGTQPFSLQSFIRVTIVSTIAASIAFVIMAYEQSWAAIGRELMVLVMRPDRFLLLLLLNSGFDYVSVTKARIVMGQILKINVQYKNTLFLIVDAVLTGLILWLYVQLLGLLFDILLKHAGFLALLDYIFLLPAFFATTFLIFFLTTMYLLSVSSFIAVRALPVFIWILSVKTLPMRSIGLMAGAILFVGLSIAIFARHLIT